VRLAHVAAAGFRWRDPVEPEGAAVDGPAQEALGNRQHHRDPGGGFCGGPLARHGGKTARQQKADGEPQPQGGLRVADQPERRRGLSHRASIAPLEEGVAKQKLPHPSQTSGRPVDEGVGALKIVVRAQ
jgi:hypothetical protein